MEKILTLKGSPEDLGNFLKQFSEIEIKNFTQPINKNKPLTLTVVFPDDFKEVNPSSLNDLLSSEKRYIASKTKDTQVSPDILQQIPIFRAREVNSKDYIEGYFAQGSFPDTTCYIMSGDQAITIDKSTLSIHFPRMLDKNNRKIFLSLSRDGKGGDILFDTNDNEHKIIPFDEFGGIQYFEGYENFEVLSILGEEDA